MTGFEITLGVAFVAAVGIAVWFARLTAKITSWQRILWTKHEKLMSAAVDLDLQVSDYRETIAKKNIDFAILDADYEALGVQFESVMKNHTLTKICHKCKVRMPKATPLVDGVYTCAKCHAKIAEPAKPQPTPTITMIYVKSAKYWKANKAEWLSFAKSRRWQIHVPKEG